jgi:hypothetical protein
MGNRNVTLFSPKDLVPRTKVFAALSDTSITALVTELLAQRVGAGTPERLWQDALEVMESGPARIGDAPLSRE